MLAQVTEAERAGPLIKDKGDGMRTMRNSVRLKIVRGATDAWRFTEGTDGQERLIFLIAAVAYLDIVSYKRYLERLLDGRGEWPGGSAMEQEYRYSLVFFLTPFHRTGSSYARYLFSLIGKEGLLDRIQEAVRHLETEIKALEERKRLLSPARSRSKKNGDRG